MRVLTIAAAAVVLLAAYALFKFSRAGYESPEYRVEASEGSYEIREYPEMVVASTPMKSMQPEGDESFMRLFRYISGANESDQKIAMTTPVLMTDEEETGTMSFIVPRELVDAGVPEASHGEVRIETIQGGRFAAFRYSGNRDPEQTETAKEKLMEWVRERDLETAGPPIVAGYDPPFTPPFLKRNEILIRLAS